MGQKNSENKKPILRMREDGSFRILCVSDVHGGKGYDADFTVAGLQKLLDKTHPDLVLMLGDVAGPGTIHIENADQLREMLDGLAAPLESAGIPWAHVFGNHDDNFGLLNREAMGVYETYPHCLSTNMTPADVTGISNYVLPIYARTGGRIAFNVFGLDSHGGHNDESGKGIPGVTSNAQFFPIELEHKPELTDCAEYGGRDRGVDFSQVMWYFRTSQKMEAENGAKIPAMMVMHVPVPEVALVEKKTNRAASGYEGGCRDDIAFQGISAGLVRACLERGDVKAICFGHDHENNFAGQFRGITLAYDGYLSAHACHNPDYFGGRVFDIRADQPGVIHTEIVLAR